MLAARNFLGYFHIAMYVHQIQGFVAWDIILRMTTGKLNTVDLDFTLSTVFAACPLCT